MKTVIIGGGLASGAGKEMKTGKDAIAEIIGVMFMSRTYSHMAHLKTGSHAKHKALNKFYDDIVDLADDLAEAAQGEWGKLEIPFKQIDGEVSDPISALDKQLKTIKELGYGCSEDYIQNILQEIEKVYKQTLYKLKELS